MFDTIHTLALPPAFGWVLIVMFASVLVCAPLLLLCYDAPMHLFPQPCLLSESGDCVCCKPVQLRQLHSKQHCKHAATSKEGLLRKSAAASGTTSTCPSASPARARSAPFAPCHQKRCVVMRFDSHMAANLSCCSCFTDKHLCLLFGQTLVCTDLKRELSRLSVAPLLGEVEQCTALVFVRNFLIHLVCKR